MTFASHSISPQTESSAIAPSVKPPRLVLEGQESTLWAFPPNRDTLGGTAYLIVQSSGNILVDCPAWDGANAEFMAQQGGLRWLFLTHRGAIAQVAAIQQHFGCEVVIQEQEAYLVPGVEVTTFQGAIALDEANEGLWTPGHSPGSACLYHSYHGGVLFTGRHLLPNQQGDPTPLRIAKTFHWPRQLRQVQALRDRFTCETLQYICPGANTGLLRGKRMIDRAYERLSQLDLTAN